MLIYTKISHIPRKSLWLTNNEYIVADTIYQLSTNPKYEWCIMTRENLAKELWMSKNGIIKIVNRLEKLNIVLKNDKKNLKTTQLWYDEVVYKVDWVGTQSSSDLEHKVVQVGTQSSPNTKYNNKTNNKPKEIEEIYSYYISKTELLPKYRNPSKSKKFIEKALKEDSKEELIKMIDAYFYECDKKWRISPAKFFNINSEKWTYYKDYKGGEGEGQEVKKKEVFTF